MAEGGYITKGSFHRGVHIVKSGHKAIVSMYEGGQL